MQVPSPEAQADVMIEAVENHMPEVIVIDEIGTSAEAAAARPIAERGVQLIATAHGNTLENLLQNPTLSDLVGGIQAVTLSDEEARRRRTQKTVLERKAPPTFDVLIEIEAKDALAVHRDVAEVVDRFLRGFAPRPERRRRRDDGEVEIEGRGAGDASEPPAPPPAGERWDPPGRRREEPRGRQRRPGGEAPGRSYQPPWPPTPAPQGPAASSRAEPRRPRAGDPSFDDAGAADDAAAPNPADSPAEVHLEAGEPVAAAHSRWPGATPGRRPGRLLRVYPYAVSRARLERAIKKYGAPGFVCEDLSQADVIVTTKSQERRQPRKLRDAQARGVPLHLVRGNTVTQLEGFVRSVFDLRQADGDEAAALEEAELAVEAVLESHRPVELAPRERPLRRLQHELAERHRLATESRGDEPYRRVVVYPP
jgi:hypothetical protein